MDDLSEDGDYIEPSMYQYFDGVIEAKMEQMEEE